MIRAAIVTAAIAACTALLGCGSSADPAGATGPTVVATTTQLGDMTRAIAGDRATVVQLLAPNTDAHEYEPTPADAKAVATADLVVENGLGLDGWVDDLVTSTGTSAAVVVASRGVRALPGDAASSAGDPHIWMDPRNARAMVDRITEGLVSVDPADAEAYRTSAAAYDRRLRRLDSDLAALVDGVPASRRRIVTDHDAFGYLTARYGITSVGTVIPSMSTGAEPNAKEMASLAATVRRAGVRVVFPEAALDPALAAALARDAGAEVGPELYADSLGPAGSPGATYIEMMRHNVRAMVDGMNRR